MHDFVLFMRFVSIFAKHLAHDFCTVFLVTQKCRKIYFPGLPRKTVLAAKKKKEKCYARKINNQQQQHPASTEGKNNGNIFFYSHGNLNGKYFYGKR